MAFNKDAFLEKLLPIIPDLSRQEKAVVKVALEHAKTDIDFMYIRERLENPDKRLMPPVSVDTFLDDPDYLGIGDNVFPKVREILRTILEGNYREALEVAGIGSGKSFSSEVIAVYLTHKLLCMRDPFRFY